MFVLPTRATAAALGHGGGAGHLSGFAKHLLRRPGPGRRGPERTGSSGFKGDGDGPGWLARWVRSPSCLFRPGFLPASPPPAPGSERPRVPAALRLPPCSLPPDAAIARGRAGPGLTSPRDRFVQILCVHGKRVFRPGVRWLLRDVPPGCPPWPSPCNRGFAKTKILCIFFFFFFTGFLLSHRLFNRS